VHIVGAIICVLIAAALTSVVANDWSATPGWVCGLALIATVALLASAARIYLAGARRKRVVEGPRTKIVLVDVPAPPPRPRSRVASAGR
jgi:hypothetical protein